MFLIRQRKSRCCRRTEGPCLRDTETILTQMIHKQIFAQEKQNGVIVQGKQKIIILKKQKHIQVQEKKRKVLARRKQKEGLIKEKQKENASKQLSPSLRTIHRAVFSHLRTKQSAAQQRLTLVDDTTQWYSVKSSWHKLLRSAICCLKSTFHTCTPGRWLNAPIIGMWENHWLVMNSFALVVVRMSNREIRAGNKIEDRNSSNFLRCFYCWRHAKEM